MRGAEMDATRLVALLAYALAVGGWSLLGVWLAARGAGDCGGFVSRLVY